MGLKDLEGNLKDIKAKDLLSLIRLPKHVMTQRMANLNFWFQLFLFRIHRDFVLKSNWTLKIFIISFLIDNFHFHLVDLAKLKLIIGGKR